MDLREGFTTGTAATAAAMASLRYLLTGVKSAQENVPLPPFAEGSPVGWAMIPVAGAGAVSEVIKDGGSDPDVTHGMSILASVERIAAPEIRIEGGEGIGTVTLPGLQVPVGRQAINPVPLQQIRAGLASLGIRAGVRVVISAPEGARRAKATLNERIGIKGGISILGTHGIVRPFSNSAWLSSIKSALNVAAACGAKRICFATGRRSAAALAHIYPELPDAAIIIAGDFVRESVQLARGAQELSWGCFLGKLVKLAQGFGNTHAHQGELSMEFLADLTGIVAIAHCNTAQLALEHILAGGLSGLKPVMAMAKRNIEDFAGRGILIHLFHADGRELARL